MSYLPRRSWLKPQSRRKPIRRRPVSLSVERFEDRSLPSSSIPLNGFTWTSIGPSPIMDGQSPGNPSSTGRLNGVALDPPIVPGQSYPFQSDPNRIYVLSDTAGVWRTTDAGQTWAQQGNFTGGLGFTITEVNRGANDTIYAALSSGFEVSTDGGQTFTLHQSLPLGLVVTKLTVNVVNPNDQSQDIIFASLSSLIPLPGDFGQGIYRSMDGGATFTRITTPGTNPFSLNSGEFTDFAFNPSNPNIAYAAVGNVLGDPFNGIYRTVNALSPNPTWQLSIGGSQFVPGSTPGGIKIAVSPSLPSVIFASVALRADPQSGAVPLLGIFRSFDSGVNWTPLYIANPQNQLTDPLNYLGSSGDDNHVIYIDPFSPASPSQQRVYFAGYGGPAAGLAGDVIFTNDSGATFSPIGVGANGIGPYPNVHQGQVDQQGRFVIATGGGIYRNNSVNPANWTSLNGQVGPTGLGVNQFYGFALHPTDPDQAIGNIDSRPVFLQDAIRFADHFGLGNNAYGWGTIDSGTPPFIDGQTGDGVVIYNPFSPNIVYRVVPGGGGQAPVRRSLDGGVTWTAVGNGFPALPGPVSGIGAVPGPRYVPPTVIDPSRPNRLLSGYNAVFATDDNGDNWRAAVQTTLNGGTIAIPPLPTTQINAQGGGPVFLDALATARQTNVDLNGFFFNGAAIFAATEFDANFDGMNYTNAAIGGPTLFYAVIPDLAPNQWPPSGTTYDNHYWAHITPPGLFGQITQIIADPIIDPNGVAGSILYVFSNSGQVLRATDLHIGYTLDANNNIIPDPTALSVTWTDITGSLPFGSSPVTYPQPLALDKNIVQLGGGQFADRLYVGTADGHVFALDDPRQDFTGSSPNWVEVGAGSLPAVPISTLAINPTTGILAAATYGQGVYELQIRGLIRGRVFEDLNGNGVFDAGEQPFTGITVVAHNLTTDDTFATVTDANGVFEFRSLTDGTYDVSVSLSGGLFQTTAAATGLVVTEQTTLDQTNFGLFRPGSISGTKFEDRNANGVRDAGEPGIAGFTIFLDANNNNTLDPGEISTITDSSGTFTFTNLGPGVLFGMTNPATFGGSYLVREVQQTGYQQTTPNPSPITLQSGQGFTGVLIGNFRPTMPGVNNHVYIVGADAGTGPVVKVYNSATNQLITQFNAYAPTFQGGVRVAVGDFNGDGVTDFVTAPGSGGGPHIKIFDGIGFGLIREFSAYDPAFRGGTFIAVGDMNGDGVSDIITGAGAGGGPHVRAFSGITNALLFNGMVYDINFRGGVQVAAGDVDGDGHADIITAPGQGGGPHVRAFSGLDGHIVANFMAYAPNFFGGVYVAAGDLNNDGTAEIITGPGIGGGPDLRVFEAVGGDGVLINEFSPFPPGTPGSGQFNGLWVSGLRVGVTDFNNDGQLDLIVGPGIGQRPRIRIFDGANLALLLELQVFDPNFLGGVFVGGN